MTRRRQVEDATTKLRGLQLLELYRDTFADAADFRDADGSVRWADVYRAAREDLDAAGRVHGAADRRDDAIACVVGVLVLAAVLVE